MEDLGEKVAEMANRLEDARRVCLTEADYEGWTRVFVSDLVKTTMPEYFCEIRKRVNPQEEERKEGMQPTFKQELDFISMRMDEFLTQFENDRNSLIQEMKVAIL
jgi:hypothetical protein